MSDTSSSSRPEAAEPLDKLLQSVDPLYRPAEFLLGYTYVARGDGKQAVPHFDALVQQFHEEFDRMREQVAEEWVGKTRFIKLAKKLPWIRKWVDVYVDGLNALYGGGYVLAAGAWENLKKALDEPPKAPVFREIHQEHIKSLVRTIAVQLGEKYPATAAGLMQPDDLSRENATMLLDKVLDKQTIWNFDFRLGNIDRQTLFQETSEGLAVWNEESAASSDSSEDLVKTLDGMMKETLGQLLEEELKDLRGFLQAKKWEEAREKIRKLHRKTMDPSPYRFDSLFNNPKIESWDARIASFFVPALGMVRRRRMDFRKPLYAESVYYLGQSLLLTFEPNNLKRCADEMHDLRELRLGAARTGRNRDLSLLTLCLETESSVRTSESDGPKWGLPSKADKTLTTAAHDQQVSIEVRSACYTALGLLERQSRLRQEEYQLREKHTFMDSDQRDKSISTEMLHYRNSLDLKPSANTHCYLVEALLEKAKHVWESDPNLPKKMSLFDQADSNIKRAVLLAPDHVLARQLTETISSQRAGAIKERDKKLKAASKPPQPTEAEQGTTAEDQSAVQNKET